MTTSPEKQVEAVAGQRYRDDEDGYLWDVVAVEPNGDAWCRHPNKKGAATLTHRAWFDRWTLIRDAEEVPDAH